MAESATSSSQGESSSPKDNEKQTSNWWDSWITSAKSKSVEVYSMVKKDFDEIGTAMKSEANHVFSSTSTAIGKTFKFDEPESPANVIKKSLSSFIGQVSTVLNPEPDDDDDTEVILSSNEIVMMSTYKKELESLQRLDATFIVPACSEEFEAWKSTFEPTEEGTLTRSIRRHQNSPLLRAQYDKLVPDAVSHEDFWERYLFRVALLQDRMASKHSANTSDPVLAHMNTAPVIQQSPKKSISFPDNEILATKVAEETVVAFDEEDFATDVELSEEQQILLLEEYEKEIASKKVTKTNTKDVTNNNSKTVQAKNPSPSKPTGTQPRDKLNNKKQNIDNAKNKKPVDKTKPVDKKTKNAKSPIKETKSDVCGNEIVEDHFGDQKDDSSANSDESWEKEFEIDEVQQKS